MDKKYMQAIKPICSELRTLLRQLPDEIQPSIWEIRLRRDKPVILISNGNSIFITKTGRITSICSGDLKKTDGQEIDDTFKACCGYSIHSHIGEIANGFVTLEGGHRVGICGTAVYENGRVVNQRNISSLNIRVAREFKGAADGLAELMRSGIKSLLIAGAPSTGKTTVLRDVARRLADGLFVSTCKVAIVDERSEIASLSHGIPQNDVGMNTDVLDGFSKGDGILQAVRTLSPDVVICDEIGGEDECAAIRCGLNSGVCFIASVHAGNEEELRRKRQITALMEDGAFEYTAFLKSGGTPSQVERIVKNEIIGTDFNCSDRLWRGKMDGCATTKA